MPQNDNDNFDIDIAESAAFDEEEPPQAAAKKSRPAAHKKSEPNRPRRRIKAVPRTGSRFRRLLISLFWTFLGLGLFGLTVVFAVYAYYSRDLPSTAGLKNYAPKTVTYFYADDGQVIGEYSHERRFVKPLEEIPEHVKNAFIAVEDAAFYSHPGVNLKAVIRAGLTYLEAGEFTQGGSTITQQVARSFLLTPERTITRKIREAILAFRIEALLTKDEILHLYLNQIYLGRGAYGVEAAARTYFDKGTEQLTVAEAAMLAGITQAPEGKNPVTNPDKARERQLYGIGRMLTVNLITPEEAAAARAEVLNPKGWWPNPNTVMAPYFAEHVRRLMVERVGEESLYNDGWKVWTTANLKAQRAADAAVSRGLWEYARRRGWKGPVDHLELEEQIAAFLTEQDKKLPVTGLDYDRLYQAVVMGVDAKNAVLTVRVGLFLGRIEKKNLSWALKGSLDKLLKRGDVVWVRLSPQNDAAGEAQEVPLTARELAALVDEGSPAGGSRELPMILEQRTDVQAALLSMDLSDGGVKAMVGGRDFNESQFNRAIQSQRQPGSSFKPILYTAAMDNGFTPGSIMNDAPLVIDDLGSGRRWKPVNSDLKFRGPMNLYSALISSRNLVSVKILDRIGFAALQSTARDMGITEKLPESLTVALGSHGIFMPELLTAYSSFPNLGRRVTPRYITRIEDRHGNVVYQSEPEFIQAISPGTACVMTSMLRGVVAQGTGSSVKPLNRPVGGKTGTTNDYSDAWFIGFTPELVTTVWMGTDQIRARAVGEVGGTAAGPIFLYYNQAALKDTPEKDFLPTPEDAVMTSGGAFGICYKAGTVGTGISEAVGLVSPQEDFLRSEFDDIDSGFLPPEMEGEILEGGGD